LHNRGEHLLRCTPTQEDGQVGTKVGGNCERKLYDCVVNCVGMPSVVISCLWGVFGTVLMVPNHRCDQKIRACLPGCVLALAGSIVPGFVLNRWEDNGPMGSWRSEAQAVD
jgi:hypothetical protein